MFEGVYTALVTPFNDGNIDFEALEKLINFNIKNGVSGLVPCGTTGETPTLRDEEYERIIKFTVDRAKGRCQVIAGAGSNSTAKAIENARIVKKSGADAALIVTPFYNKPTQQGLFEHYKAIADEVDIPQIVYNVPGRTGCNILPETMERLSTINNVKGVKEASGNLVQITEIKKRCPDDFSILSGDDPLFIPVLSIGGSGIISVTSNIMPKVFSEVYALYVEGRLNMAREKFSKVFPLTQILFIETNPIPVKTALSLMGYIKEEFRLPLCKIAIENKEKLKDVLESLELI